MKSASRKTSSLNLAGILAPVVLLFVVQPARATCVPPPSGMVAWWPAENNAVDTIGGHNGILDGSISFGPGLVGTAFLFNSANDDYVSVPDSPTLDFDSAPITIAMWIMRSGTTSSHILGKRHDACSGSVTEANYQILYSPGGFPGQIEFGGPHGPHTNTGTDLLPLDSWVHLACVGEEQSPGVLTIKIYINGDLKVSVPNSGLGPVNADPLKIGGSGLCPSWEGGIDELQIFNRALTQAEIQSIVDAGSSGVTVPPAGTPSMSVVKSGTDAVLSWDALAGAATYDVVEGNLLALTSTAGNFTGAVSSCIANDVVATTATSSTLPPPGGASWYVARGSNCGGAGTYDEESGGGQQGSRDVEIDASASACP